MSEKTTIPVWKTTRHYLKVIAALSGKTMIQLLDDLVMAEAEQRGLVVSSEDSGESQRPEEME